MRMSIENKAAETKGALASTRRQVAAMEAELKGSKNTKKAKSKIF